MRIIRNNLTDEEIELKNCNEMLYGLIAGINNSISRDSVMQNYENAKCYLEELVHLNFKRLVREGYE